MRMPKQDAFIRVMSAHRFVNRSNARATILVIGDRTPLDEIDYPTSTTTPRPAPTASTSTHARTARHTKVSARS
jgi:uncharacterized cupin superfamily protein